MHFEEELLSKGIKADISLEEERLDNPTGVEFFLWLPTTDHTPPSQNSLDLGVQTLALCEKRNMPCYVHCKNGHGRGPTLVAAYLMQSKGLSADDAIALIKERRTSIHLQPSQVEALQSLTRT